MIDGIIDTFNFEKVHVAMTVLDWQWASREGRGYAVPTIAELKAAVPTIAELKAKAYYLLQESITETCVSSGGFEAKYQPADNSDSEYFELKFILCHEDSYDD
jgi:hypothetical protein